MTTRDKQYIITCLATLLAVWGLSACSEEQDAPLNPKTTPMRFTVVHPGQSRATDTDFENGDRIGLFVNDEKAALEIGGNLVNNEAFTYNGTSWNASRTLYWDEGTYNAYAYYPYLSTVSSIEDLPFSVSLDQSATVSGSDMDGYEASDFLYAKAQGIVASATPIPLTFRHIMSKLTVRLVKGEDYEGDLPTDAVLLIHNTVPTATIDLSAGVATRDTKGTRATITAKQTGDHTYAAIIVPQRISNRMPLAEVEIKGVSYLYESTFQFKEGVNHLVNLVISDNPEQVKIEVGGEIENWQ